MPIDLGCEEGVQRDGALLLLFFAYHNYFFYLNGETAQINDRNNFIKNMDLNCCRSNKFYNF